MSRHPLSGRFSLSRICTVSPWRWLLAIITTGMTVAVFAASNTSGNAREIPIDGAIGPALSHFVVDEMKTAIKDDVPLIILRLDTPGGLSTSMHEIIKTMLTSPVPVVAYVAPSGSRAASAGTYIMYAAQIAAMAPATHLGAATPVEIGGDHDFGKPADHKSDHKQSNGSSGDQSDTSAKSESSKDDLSSSQTERRKQINDATAYIRSLAEQHGRNADWAEQAVQHAVSITAREALKQNVINFIAADEHDLLQKIDGEKVQTASGSVTIHSKDLSIQHVQPDWKTELLSIVTQPTIAYLLFMIGIIGLAAEAFAPGTAVPGVIGGICLITALFAFHLLPVSYSGAALVILGAALFVAEGFVPSFGALGLGGIAAIVFGSIMLMDSGVTGYNVSMGIILGIAIGAIIILGFMLWMFAGSRKKRVATGHEGLMGCECTALEDFTREGRVWLHGESWQAISESPVVQNQRLTVTAVKGLTVHVRPHGPSADPLPSHPTPS